MNEIQTKRAVYYGLLIVCLASALLTVFLPFAYEPSFQENEFLAPMSVPAALMPGTMTYLLQKPDYNWVQPVYVVLLLFAGVTVNKLIRALLRVLRSLNRERRSSAPALLGAAPTVGLCFFTLLMILGIWNQSYLNEHISSRASYFQPIWPLVGLLLSLAAKGLARGLRETDKELSCKS